MTPSRSLKIQTVPRPDDSSLPDDAARLVLSADGTILFASSAFEKLAGIRELKGRRFSAVADFKDPEEAFRNTSLLFGSNGNRYAALRSGQHELVFLKSGEEALLQFDLIARGEQSYILASALEDDAQFNQSFEAFLTQPQTGAGDEAGKALSHFLELSNDLLIVSHADGRFDTVNEGFTRLLGYGIEDLEDRAFLDLVHPDDRAAARAAMQTLMRDDSVYNEEPLIDFECRVLSNEARSFWMEWKHRKADGKLYSVGRDLSAIKKHEEALTRRERQLSEAEAIGHMGHWSWKLGQQDIRFSDEVYRIFGVAKDGFKPTIDSVNAMLHRSDAGRLSQAFQRAIIEQNDHDIDFRVLTPEGDVRYVRCRGKCEFDKDGDVIGLYGIMQDVTQAQIHERALMESKEAAERAYAAKSQFLANMSHELRTPLNAIIGFSEMMQQQLLGPLGNDRYMDYIKGIRESGEHLLDLITDILDMSKIEAGKYELAIEQVNIIKVIKLAVHMIEGRALEAGIRIALRAQDEELQIYADRRACMQMILNLLSNAVKFSRRDGKVDIECVAQDGFISLRVKDRGIGIPANKLKTITNPFEQAANQYTRSHEGSGLGLSITKELAVMHGGSIHIESAVDVGTTVTIRLPFDARSTQQNPDGLSDAAGLYITSLQKR